MTHHTTILGWNNAAVEGDKAAADKRLLSVTEQSMKKYVFNKNIVATFRSY